jgi:hypothetical protein
MGRPYGEGHGLFHDDGGVSGISKLVDIFLRCHVRASPAPNPEQRRKLPGSIRTDSRTRKHWLRPRGSRKTHAKENVETQGGL